MRFKLAERANIQVSPIRKIFAQLPDIIEKRKKDGLDPLIDLSIGQPHLEPNPEVMKKMREMEEFRESQGYTCSRGKKNAASHCEII